MYILSIFVTKFYSWTQIAPTVLYTSSIYILIDHSSNGVFQDQWKQTMKQIMQMNIQWLTLAGSKPVGYSQKWPRSSTQSGLPRITPASGQNGTRDKKKK